MTTSRSSRRAIRKQSDKIAAMIKAAERGEKLEPRFAAKIEEARARRSFKIGIIMDDKIVTVEMPWETIRKTDEEGLSEFIFRQMKGQSDAVH